MYIKYVNKTLSNKNYNVFDFKKIHWLKLVAN